MSVPMPSEDRPKGSFWQALRAVAWSFFGIRRSSGLQHDAARLDAVQVIAAGLVGVAIFVAVLVLLVRWVVSSGVAA